MECNNLETLKIVNLKQFWPLSLKDKYLTEKIKNDFNYVKNNRNIDKDFIDSLARLILREKLWCKLESKKMFIHFGWDYYMYIGSLNHCEKYIQTIKSLGLFVKEYNSPYLD